MRWLQEYSSRPILQSPQAIGMACGVTARTLTSSHHTQQCRHATVLGTSKAAADFKLKSPIQLCARICTSEQQTANTAPQCCSAPGKALQSVELPATGWTTPLAAGVLPSAVRICVSSTPRTAPLPVSAPSKPTPGDRPTSGVATGALAPYRRRCRWPTTARP